MSDTLGELRQAYNRWQVDFRKTAEEILTDEQLICFLEIREKEYSDEWQRNLEREAVNRGADRMLAAKVALKLQGIQL